MKSFMSTDQLEQIAAFEEELKAEEKITFLVEYLKSDQLYPEYCTEVSWTWTSLHVSGQLRNLRTIGSYTSAKLVVVLNYRNFE